MSSQKIGFIGLGDMGLPMATRLLNHGRSVTSCVNKNRDAIEVLLQLGVSEVDTPSAVGAASDVVITMVRDTRQTKQVIYGPDGALAGMKEGAVLIIMSTLSPEDCREIASKAAEQGVSVLDSPVSGLPQRAVQGTLALMVGGDAETLEQCREVLEDMGKIFHCGDVGTGTVSKLANNAVLMGTMKLLLEARAFASAYDMPPDTLMEIFANSSANSFPVQNWAALEANWDHYDTLLNKDVALCLEAAGHKEIAMPLTDAANRLTVES
jgi:3-hydroxyisobutyrate dehydrogenase-like beta-hydroxyacid dehydrogenase